MPGGLYTAITRAPGTLITALIYNTDHQNDCDGRSALLMAGYGISLSQFQLTEDPLPGGVESLPFSLAGELTRIRFCLAQIKTAISGNVPVNWYDPLVGPGLPVVGARISRAAPQAIPTGVVTTMTFSSGVADFNSGVWSNGTPTRFTAPVSGRYYAFCTTTWDGVVSTSGRRQIQIGVNGTFADQAVLSNINPSNGLVQPQAVTGLVNLVATDYVEFAAFQDVTATLNLTPTGSGIVFLGA